MNIASSIDKLSINERLDKWRESKTRKSLNPSIITNSSKTIGLTNRKISTNLKNSPIKERHSNSGFSKITNDFNCNPSVQTNLMKRFRKSIIYDKTNNTSKSIHNEANNEMHNEQNNNPNRSNNSSPIIDQSKSIYDNMFSPDKNNSPEQIKRIRSNDKTTSPSNKCNKSTDEYQLLLTENNNINKQLQDKSNQFQMIQEDYQSLQFLSGVQEQRINELEDILSNDRINHNESVNHKIQKYKDDIIKLKKEKKDYEERANTMILQMTEQMTRLQQKAMLRIEILERDLLNERKNYEKLQEENKSLVSNLSSQQYKYKRLINQQHSYASNHSLDRKFSDITISSNEATPPQVRRRGNKEIDSNITSPDFNDYIDCNDVSTSSHHSNEDYDEDI